MKITLKDFGPISHFEFDLEKDLHVIFGKNSVGKSYAITAVYLILKNIIEEPETHYIKSEIINYAQNEIIKESLLKNEKQINIDKRTTIMFRGIIEGIFVRNLTQSINRSFISITELSNKLSNCPFIISLQYGIFTLQISCNKDLNTLFIKEFKINSTLELYWTTSITSFFTLKDDSEERSFHNISSCLAVLYDSFIPKLKNSIKNTYFLPAFRSGYYLTLNAAFSGIFIELSKNRDLLKNNKIEFPFITEQVADYSVQLSLINNIAKNEFNEIIESIEKNILRGKVLFNNEAKKIVFKQDIFDVDIDLAFTSSMISELSIIVAYLKYIINDEINSGSYCVLFIEEPEAHLHPEAQVLLMNVFAKLAGKYIKIVMTSHSNYMFNELSNLILEGKIDHNKVSSNLMRNTEKGSITDARSMKAEADGMNDENFADIAEMLYEERIKIYEKLNKASENVD